MGEPEYEHNPRTRHFLRVFTPLFLLILFVGSINLLPRWQMPVTTAVPEATPTTEHTTPVSDMNAETAVMPTPTTQPTNQPGTLPPPPPPTFPSDAAIQLLGPPADSTFENESAVSFYWHWPFPLEEDQQFAVYLLDEQEEVLLGVVSEPNVGLSYHLGVVLSDLEPGRYGWQTRLERIQPEMVLAESEIRWLTLTRSAANKTD